MSCPLEALGPFSCQPGTVLIADHCGPEGGLSAGLESVMGPETEHCSNSTEILQVGNMGKNVFGKIVEHVNI